MSFQEKPLHILVVEDNPGDYLLIEDYLKEEIIHSVIHHTTTFAAAKAILLRENEFDIILLDLSLADESGEVLVNKIIEIAEYIPVIVLTGYADKEFSIKTLTLGISDYLVKDELSSLQLGKSIYYSIERKRISIQLNESEKKYRNLFHLSPLPMWVYDVETLRFLNINEAAIVHYGYSQEEFMNMTIKDIRPASELKLLEDMLLAYDQPTTFKHGTFRHLKKNGQLIDVDIQSNEINFDGRKARLILAIDISERTSYIKAIEDQNAKMQEIAWIQSHVVRAPLARIMGLMNLLKMAPAEEHETTKEIMDYIHFSAQELDEIIRKIVSKTADIESKMS